MTVPFASVLALALAFAGMAGLCLGMEKHFRQLGLRRQSPPVRRVLRLAGWALLALALLPCLKAWGTGVGIVVWLGFLSVGAVALVWLLAYRPRTASALALCAGLAALAGLAAA